MLRQLIYINYSSMIEIPKRHWAHIARVTNPASKYGATRKTVVVYKKIGTILQVNFSPLSSRDDRQCPRTAK